MRKTALLLLIPFAAFAAPDFPEMSRKAVELRVEVESSGRELESAQRRHQSELDSILSRRADLDAQLRKEDLRQTQLREKILTVKKKVMPKRPATRAEIAVLETWVKDLRAWVASSLPFRREARGEEIARFSERLKKGESPELIAADLWSFTDKELRLSRDNSVEISTLDFAGASRKAEVARLGWFQMVFVTADGTAGTAENAENGWVLRPASSADEEAAIRRLVTKLKEGRGAGSFVIPAPLKEEI